MKSRRTRTNPNRLRDVKPVTVYLKPAQHERAKRLAEQESKRASQASGFEVQLNVSDIIRLLIDRAELADEASDAFIDSMLPDKEGKQ